MRVKVRYFARYRSLVGKSEEELEVPDGTTVRELLEILTDKYPPLKNELEDLNVSLNGKYVGLDEVLHDGDVVAIFPPVSGG